MRSASRRQDPRASPSTASRSSSRTISMSPACRRRRPVRLSPIAPSRSAFVVERLERAGAIVIGKTNLDQFATGLVGVRSPYGVPRNALRSDLIPGGSSSGSATAVGAGLVPFSLGTDTAGSGRVPAALNGIVGLKPSLGALSTSGVVPACRTLDTVSIFARDVADAFTVFREAIAFDEQDAYSRSFHEPPFRRSRAGFGSAFPARISGSSSTIRTRQPRSRKTFGSLNRLAPASSSSTSSPSPRSPACSMTVRGSPSATRRPSR